MLKSTKADFVINATVLFLIVLDSRNPVWLKVKVKEDLNSGKEK